MKFILHTRDTVTGATWEEPYDKPWLKTEEEVRWWGKLIIAEFNYTLRPGEYARELLNVTIKKARKRH